MICYDKLKGIYACLHIYIYICIYRERDTHMYVCIYIHTYIHMCIRLLAKYCWCWFQRWNDKNNKKTTELANYCILLFQHWDSISQYCNHANTTHNTTLLTIMLIPILILIRILMMMIAILAGCWERTPSSRRSALAPASPSPRRSARRRKAT